MQTSAPYEIAPARWPADEPAAIRLLRNYAAHLARNPAGAESICLQGYEAELATLSTRWSQPNGVLLLAFLKGEAAGCVAVKVRHDREQACEMKRLWVEESSRGTGLGEALIEAAVAWARQSGAHALLLDTVPAAMPAAVALYRRLGFVETERHNANDVPGLAFFERILR